MLAQICVVVAAYGFLKNFFAVFTRTRTYLHIAIKTASTNYAYRNRTTGSRATASMEIEI